MYLLFTCRYLTNLRYRNAANTTKNRYAFAAHQALERNKIMYLHKGVSANPFKSGEPRSKFVKNKMELETQLSRCRRELSANGQMSNKHFVWSGKVDGEGRRQKGLNDDLAITFCLCIYWAHTVTHSRYPTVDYNQLGIDVPPVNE